jgi:hypothetical protein
MDSIPHNTETIMIKHIWTSIFVGTIALSGAGCLDSADDADAEDTQSQDLEAVALNLPSGCSLTASAPTYASGTISARASISCSSAHNLWVRAGVYINGSSILSTSQNICNGATSCSATARTPNRSGNQTWCTRAEGDSNPTSNPTIRTACESSGF